MDRRNKDEKLHFRRTVQAVFQDPYSSLDPRQKVGQAISEPLDSLGLSKQMTPDQVAGLVATTLTSVGLEPNIVERYPHEFSGGQRQRIAIARAIISKPKLLLADEPVSSLDLKNRELILELFKALQIEYQFTTVIVSHDLSVVAQLCQQIVVLERGVIVESGSIADVLGNPQHKYTQKLLKAIPLINS